MRHAWPSKACSNRDLSWCAARQRPLKSNRTSRPWCWVIIWRCEAVITHPPAPTTHHPKIEDRIHKETCIISSLTCVVDMRGTRPFAARGRSTSWHALTAWEGGHHAIPRAIDEERDPQLLPLKTRQTAEGADVEVLGGGRCEKRPAQQGNDWGDTMEQCPAVERGGKILVRFW